MKTNLVANRSLSGQIDFEKITGTLVINFERSSTGKHINQSAGIAERLSIASKLNFKMKFSSRAQKNAFIANTFIQVAENSCLYVHAIPYASESMSKVTSEIKSDRGNALELGNEKQMHSHAIYAWETFDIDSPCIKRALKSLYKIAYTIEKIPTARAYCGSNQTSLLTAANLSNTSCKQFRTWSRKEDANVTQQNAEVVKGRIVHNKAVSIRPWVKERPQSALNLLNTKARRKLMRSRNARSG